MELKFDRIVLRHFNETIEFQSDDSVVEQGFDFELNVRYDVCEWTERDMNLQWIWW